MIQYTVVAIHDSSNEEIIAKLSEGLAHISADVPYYDNYSPDRRGIPGNLFTILEQGRYLSGAYFVVFDDYGKYAASAGWYQSDFCQNTALVLTRAYTLPRLRNQFLLAEYCLTRMISATVAYERVWITCNQYNRAIYDYVSRTRTHKSPTVGNKWPLIYNRFRPIGTRTVYNTEQYVLELERTIE